MIAPFVCRKASHLLAWDVRIQLCWNKFPACLILPSCLPVWLKINHSTAIYSLPACLPAFPAMGVGGVSATLFNRVLLSPLWSRTWSGPPAAAHRPCPPAAAPRRCAAARRCWSAARPWCPGPCSTPRADRQTGRRAIAAIGNDPG